MKKLFLVSFCLLAVMGKAQTNLVPNPSFELYDTCPDHLSQISRAIGWYSSSPSPDYFNLCGLPINGISVPFTAFGYRTAASGNAYSGEIVKAGGVNESREIIGTQLITPLVIGTKYYVSFKVSLAGEAGYVKCGINKLGVLFSTLLYDDSSPVPICNCAQVYTNSIITDTLNWTRIKGSFVADSNYSYVNVGRFFSNPLTDSIQITGSNCNAYYFVDDCVVSTDSAYAYNYSYTGINELSGNETIEYFPNPARDWIAIRGNDIQSLTLCDVLGRIIYANNFDIISPYLLNVTSFSRGIYFLSTKTKSGIINKKIILN